MIFKKIREVNILSQREFGPINLTIDLFFRILSYFSGPKFLRRVCKSRKRATINFQSPYRELRLGQYRTIFFSMSFQFEAI